MTPYYDADGITLYLGDCREQTAWLTADVLVTDPPYGIAWRKGLNRAAGSRAHSGIVNDHDTAARDTVLLMAAHMPAIVFGSLAATFPERLKQTLIWQKANDAGVVGSVTGFRRDIEAVFLVGDWPQRTVQWSSVLRSRAAMVGGSNSPAGRTGHPHSKPLDLMEQLIAACPPGVVADPFAGSGATARRPRAGPQGHRSGDRGAVLRIDRVPPGARRSVRGDGMKSLWWHLAMEYHLSPSWGHGTGNAHDCGACQQIHALTARWTAANENSCAVDNPASSRSALTTSTPSALREKTK